jgi:hypothetical protein
MVFFLGGFGGGVAGKGAKDCRVVQAKETNWTGLIVAKRRVEATLGLTARTSWK